MSLYDDSPVATITMSTKYFCQKKSHNTRSIHAAARATATTRPCQQKNAPKKFKPPRPTIQSTRVMIVFTKHLAKNRSQPWLCQQISVPKSSNLWTEPSILAADHINNNVDRVYKRNCLPKKTQTNATMILRRKLFAKRDQTSDPEPYMLPTMNNDDLENKSFC